MWGEGDGGCEATVRAAKRGEQESPCIKAT
jgi:hypothetical protein